MTSPARDLKRWCPMADLEARVCRDDTGQRIVSAHCPHWSDCDAERRELSQKHNAPMTDEEVRDLGHSHRDETGRWVHKRELETFPRGKDRRAQARARGARRCLSCGIDPHEREHLPWCNDAPPSVGAALRDARDIEAAIAWQPPERDLPKLSPPEREQLGTLFDALVRARERARGETPPKLWTLKEYRDSVARRRKESA